MNSRFSIPPQTTDDVLFEEIAVGSAVFSFFFGTDLAGGGRPGQHLETLAGDGQRRASTPALNPFIALPRPKTTASWGNSTGCYARRQYPLWQRATIIGHGQANAPAYNAPTNPFGSEPRFGIVSLKLYAEVNYFTRRSTR